VRKSTDFEHGNKPFLLRQLLEENSRAGLGTNIGNMDYFLLYYFGFWDLAALHDEVVPII
jgi:hypothetical protein